MNRSCEQKLWIQILSKICEQKWKKGIENNFDKSCEQNCEDKLWPRVMIIQYMLRTEVVKQTTLWIRVVNKSFEQMLQTKVVKIVLNKICKKSCEQELRTKVQTSLAQAGFKLILLPIKR